MASGKIISFTNIRLPRPSFRFTNDMRPTNSEYVDKNATFKKFLLQFLSLFQYCGRLTFCNISVFKAGCIYQLRVVQVQNDLEEARRPRKRCGATVAVCVEEGGCVCVSASFLRGILPSASCGPVWKFPPPGVRWSRLPSALFNQLHSLHFLPSFTVGFNPVELVRTWLRIPGSLEGPLPPEPEPAGPVPT